MVINPEENQLNVDPEAGWTASRSRPTRSSTRWGGDLRDAGVPRLRAPRPGHVHPDRVEPSAFVPASASASAPACHLVPRLAVEAGPGREVPGIGHPGRGDDVVVEGDEGHPIGRLDHGVTAGSTATDGPPIRTPASGSGRFTDRTYAVEVRALARNTIFQRWYVFLRGARDEDRLRAQRSEEVRPLRPIVVGADLDPDRHPERVDRAGHRRPGL